MYMTQEEHGIYRSVGLKETDLGLQYGDKRSIVRGFEGDVGQLVDLLVGETKQEAEKSGSAKALNKLGIRYAEYGRYDKAEAMLRQALAKDAAYLNAEINLANVLFLKKDYAEALAGFQGCYEKLAAKQEEGGAMAQKLLVSISKTYYQLEQYDEATASFAKASAIDAEKVKEFAYLGQRTGSGGGGGAAEGRAAEGRDLSREVLYAEEVEP
jgi:tetratricopeptide (TPR) repeat protein